MAGTAGAPKRDRWGERPQDPFLRELMKDPKRAARLSMMFTVGLILFWIFFVFGLIFIIAYLVF
ncbi:MAG: hypothetical protein JW939_02400 [Candidatus Thermoplasmatota archaeon]|nr:hypothetical protein [Candidatus Thermoplasmatota archaeon]